MTPEDRVIFYERIGLRIRAARTARRLTQRDLAERLGVTDVTVHYWESAKHRPDLFDLRRIEAALGQEVTR